MASDPREPENVNERELVRRFQSANVLELAKLLSAGSAPQDLAFRTYLGSARFQRLRDLAMKAGSQRGSAGRARSESVVVVPGFMGSELTAIRSGRSTRVWPDVDNLRAGWFQCLRLADDGRTSYDPTFDVQATAILNADYGELILKLSERWDVQPFWYDWRKDFEIAAAELEAHLWARCGRRRTHIVAHSTGGMVVHALLQRRASLGGGENTTPIGRVVMLGTPHRGAWTAIRFLVGADEVVRRLARLLEPPGMEWQRDSTAFRNTLRVIDSFVSLYCLLPRPTEVPGSGILDALYNARTYAAFRATLSQSHLDHARDRLEARDEPIGSTPIIGIAGYGRPTVTDLVDLSALDQIEGYEVSFGGDGRVSLDSACPTDPSGQPYYPTYYVKESHAGLVCNPSVLTAIDELLLRGETRRLESNRPVDLGSATQADALKAWNENLMSLETDFDDSSRRLQSRDVRLGRPSRSGPADFADQTSSAATNIADQISPDERTLEALLGNGFLGGEPTIKEEAAGPVPEILIELIHTKIEDAHDPTKLDHDTKTARRYAEQCKARPVDAIAVGHYLGVLPQNAVRAIDEAITQALRERAGKSPPEASDSETQKPAIPRHQLILTQYTERGILRGELGQPFFLPDPRASKDDRVERLIAIAGMGLTGRFGVPELTVLSRELCWSLGRMGKRHLATVLIGSGVGNLPIPDAVHAWLRGISMAMSGSVEDQRSDRHLAQITFVEFDPRRAIDIDQTLKLAVADYADRLKIRYTPKRDDERDDLMYCWAEKEHQEAEKRLRDWQQRDWAVDDESGRAPTRVTLTRERDGFLFGAITDTASIPQRKVSIDPELVSKANDELAAEGDLALQHERGQFLGHLLIPSDLRPQFFTRDPLVMLLDSNTARIHWEMVSQSDWEVLSSSSFDPLAFEQLDLLGRRRSDESFNVDAFLGTCRGLTRQLRTPFAPPPEPPPPPRRVLRVLVVADPAEDAPLPGAQKEGVEVADLFEAFNSAPHRVGNRVEVTRMIGPAVATRTNVLREVMSRSYDVLHYAGHCTYNKDDPPASGWVFSGGELLSAFELNRIDRIPKFVFSNACESGITPERPEGRTVELAPSFAEAFFQRGVANFVCTAWPVDDLAARQFALWLYAGLLGLPVEPRSSVDTQDALRPRVMYAAMRDARRQIALTNRGARTWGSYQHYGNPYFRFFVPLSENEDTD